MTGVRFTEFPDGGNIRINDEIAGIRNGLNYRFELGNGIQDSAGNFIFQYATIGASAVNSLYFQNSGIVGPVVIAAIGGGDNISIDLIPKGSGEVRVTAPVNATKLIASNNITIIGDEITTPSGDINIIPAGELNVPTPINGTNAATKEYVDSALSDRLFFFSLQYASTDPYIAIYNNGASGVGATLTNNSVLGAFTIDGETPPFASTIVIKDQVNQIENGAYALLVVGDNSTPWVLIRVPPFDQSFEIREGVVAFILKGNTNAISSWYITEPVNTVGVDPIIIERYAFAPDDLVTLADAQTITGEKTFTVINVSNLTLENNTISSNNINGDINITPDGLGSINLNSNSIVIGEGLIHSGDTNTFIRFGNDIQEYQTGGSIRLDLDNLGVRFGGGNARVSTILDDVTLSADSSTILATQHAIKSYVDTNDTLQEAYNNGNEILIEQSRPFLIKMPVPNFGALENSFSGGTTLINNVADRIEGWRFVVGASDVRVTALQYVDANFTAGGTRQVGLYEFGTETLLASTNVAKTDPLVSGFRTTAITPVILTAGQTYVISTVVPAGENYYVSTVQVPSSLISSVPGSADAPNTSVLQYPATFQSNPNQILAGGMQLEEVTYVDTSTFEVSAGTQSINALKQLSLSDNLTFANTAMSGSASAEINLISGQNFKINSTTSGLVVANMTFGQMASITNKTTGMINYLTDINRVSYFNTIGTIFSLATTEDAKLQQVYNSSGTGQISLISGKPFSLSSIVAGFLMPRMTTANFDAILKTEGESAFSTDEDRPLYYDGSTVKKVAYLSDNPANIYYETFKNIANTSGNTFLYVFTLGLSAFAEGTWVKLNITGATGYSSLTAGTISSSVGTTSIAVTGVYEISFSCSYRINSPNYCVLLVSAGINQSDANKIQSALVPMPISNASTTANLWQSISCTEIYNLSGGDDVKFFISELKPNNDTGADDIQFSGISLSIKKIS